MRRDTIFIPNIHDEISSISIGNSYSFFNGAVSFMAGLCATNLVMDSYTTEAIPYREGHYIWFEGRKNVSNKIFYFFPFDIYRHIMNNEWPEVLLLHYKEKNFEDQTDYIEGEIVGFEKVFLSLGQATYIQFWELIKSGIIERFGSDQTKWSSIFQFGWIIRNALAHNFKIVVNNQKIENVVWKNLNFGYTTNGTDISEHIMFIELIILMKEIEDELKFIH